MWAYWNPVKIEFGVGRFDFLSAEIANRPYAIITYPEAPFQELVTKLSAIAGKPVLVVNDIAPNPDYALLGEQCARFSDLKRPIELIVALVAAP